MTENKKKLLSTQDLDDNRYRKSENRAAIEKKKTKKMMAVLNPALFFETPYIIGLVTLKSASFLLAFICRISTTCDGIVMRSYEV